MHYRAHDVPLVAAPTNRQCAVLRQDLVEGDQYNQQLAQVVEHCAQMHIFEARLIQLLILRVECSQLSDRVLQQIVTSLHELIEFLQEGQHFAELDLDVTLTHAIVVQLHDLCILGTGCGVLGCCLLAEQRETRIEFSTGL